jgi:hypothetical protein
MLINSCLATSIAIVTVLIIYWVMRRYGIRGFIISSMIGGLLAIVLFGGPQPIIKVFKCGGETPLAAADVRSVCALQKLKGLTGPFFFFDVFHNHREEGQGTYR